MSPSRLYDSIKKPHACVWLRIYSSRSFGGTRMNCP
ncbi:MAG: hypothetical protein FD148_333, partial [Methylocystaceae bacterium]